MFAAGLAMTPVMADAVSSAVTRAQTAVARWESERSYFNFSERAIDAARLYPPHTYHRLRKIKAAYDPNDVFLSNHPIAPARSDDMTGHQSARRQGYEGRLIEQ